ncbi:hypothetical protein PUR61_43450 [Streptomyces sp. BE20]|uniref:hypothetical protein n=1 Tax=Streptomyces sp. BE20 TaxID=3002525 RepID=UPI002E7A0DD2|nr:hypothetical protein [Streptomyces sp. BE20]MEE1828972.1 hypothetical protein [Streptomyces sp. BE20]
MSSEASAVPTNGAPRPGPNSAPADGGPTSPAPLIRASSCAGACLSCSGGTTERSASSRTGPLYATVAPITTATGQGVDEGRPVQGHRRRDARGGEQPGAVGGDQDPPAVVPVGDRAAVDPEGDGGADLEGSTFSTPQEGSVGLPGLFSHVTLRLSPERLVRLRAQLKDVYDELHTEG